MRRPASTRSAATPRRGSISSTPAKSTPAELLPIDAAIGDIAGLVLALADHLGIERFAYAGISMGGAVGLWLAVHHPDRVASLMLVSTSARFGEPDRWHERAHLVRTEGIGLVADTAPGRWFTPGFTADPAAQMLVADLLATDATAYAASCDALASFDLRAELSRIIVSTLVVPPCWPRCAAISTAVARNMTRLSPVTTAPAMPRASPCAGPFWASPTWIGRSPGRATRRCMTLTAMIANGHQEQLVMHSAPRCGTESLPWKSRKCCCNQPSTTGCLRPTPHSPLS